MPRSVNLTWVPGAKDSGRAGRWRKKYKGKTYYFAGGRGKTDREAYEAAVAAWDEEKIKIDRDAPRPHQRDHETAIGQWEQVAAWCFRHGDRELAELATKKLESLRKRLAAPILSKLDREDWFESLFDNPAAADPEWMAQLEKMVVEHDQWLSTLPTVSVSIPVLPSPSIPALPVPALPAPSRSATLIQPSMDLDGSPRRIEKEIWRDRLEVQKMKAASDDQSLRAYVDRYLKDKEHQAAAGEISVGRQNALISHLTHFQDCVGKDTAVGEIDGETLARYHGNLLGKVTSKTWSRATAGHCMTSVKSFVRWLWQIEAISTLPRVLDGKSTVLTISKPMPKVITFTKEEITSLLGGASDRTKLYVLLMLNTAMTQKDIADLQLSEVDWNEGRIVRKRSKTADCENVPTVNYLLWPETLRLLKQERAVGSKDLVLRNTTGNPIWSEEITSDGKYKKNDNVRNAFERLRKKLKIGKPLKSLKKSSASLLHDNEKFSALASLFLGHAPRSISDRHYTQVPQNLFDQAIRWLGTEFGLVAPSEKPKAEESAAKPSDPAPAPEPDAAEPAANQESKARTSRAGRRSKAAKARPAASPASPAAPPE